MGVNGCVNVARPELLVEMVLGTRQACLLQVAVSCCFEWKIKTVDF